MKYKQRPIRVAIKVPGQVRNTDEAIKRLGGKQLIAKQVRKAHANLT